MITSDIIEVIKSSCNIGVTYHLSADGDSIGSALALATGLRKFKKRVYIISKESVPEIYSFLPGSEEITGLSVSVEADTDCVIAVDCGNPERLNGNFSDGKRDYSLINLDHHLSNSMYGDLNYVDTKASAAGEVVYGLLKLLGIEIDRAMAAALYTAIMTDCGSFRYSNTTAETHSIAGELISTGIDFSEIYRNVYENKKFTNIKLLGLVIGSMELAVNGKLCIMELRESMLKQMDMEIRDTSELIAEGMQVDSIETAVLFKETPEGTKVSLRSKSSFDVRTIAEAFGGGGHTKAAGCTINQPIDEAKKVLLELLEKELISWMA